MKLLKLSALALFVGTLTACSGGGGGSDNQATQPKQPITNNETKQPTSPAKPAQPNKPTQTEQSKQPTKPTQPEQPKTQLTNPIQPKVEQPNNTFIEIREFPKGEFKNENIEFGKVTGFNRQYSANGAWVEPMEISEIEVESKKFALSHVSAIGGLQGRLLSNAVSALWNASKTPNHQVFYFGQETPTNSIPKSGKATYIGNATRYDNISANLGNVGTSKLEADFDNKTIEGELAMNGFRRNIALKETAIVGNGFNGKAVAGENSLFTTRNGVYEGKFYGPNAEEVAGKATFVDDQNKEIKDLATSFSAEKVK